MKKYEMIINDIRSDISEGKYSYGDKLPNEYEFMEKYGVSRITVQNALRILKSSGVIERTPKLGTFVSKKYVEQTASKTVYLIIYHSVKELLKIIEGAQKYTQLFSGDIIIKIRLTNGDPRLEREYCEEAVANNAKGIVLFSINESFNKDYFFKIVTGGTNIVFIDRKPPYLPCNFVVSNNFIGMQIAADYLVSLGHRKIAYISCGILNSLDERREGYLYSLNKNGLAINYDYIFQNARQLTSVNSDPSEVDDNVERIIAMEAPPTAIICCNDICAMFTIRKLRKTGKRVPEDFSVCGYDNAEYSRSAYMSVSTVDMEFEQVGYTAMQIIMDSEKGGKITQIKIMPRLIARGSTAKTAIECRDENHSRNGKAPLDCADYSNDSDYFDCNEGSSDEDYVDTDLVGDNLRPAKKDDSDCPSDAVKTPIDGSL